MRLILDTKDRQVLETDTPGEYIVVGMTTAKLPDSGELMPVQDLEHPLCTIRFTDQKGVTIEDLLAIINDRKANEKE